MGLGFAALSSPVSAGSFSLLTYNVAGIPNGLSGSTPEVNNALISPRLNAFDLVLVQEDFGFHADLVSQIDHAHQSVKDTSDRPPATFGLGDGLNRFSRSPFTDHQRTTWTDCFGLLSNASDCLAPKGFSYARHEVESGAFVDVYNLHAEAGSGPEDVAARQANLRQLYAAINLLSVDEAIIVTGDFNSRYTRDTDILPELLSNTGLRDVWVEGKRAGLFPNVGPREDACTVEGMSGGDCEQIDKILFRSGQNLILDPRDYAVLDLQFQDALGVPLSDHEPVSAVFDFSLVPEPSQLVLLGVLLGAVLPRVRRT